jgi:small-conductance mechanosensitive channel
MASRAGAVARTVSLLFILLAAPAAAQQPAGAPNAAAGSALAAPDTAPLTLRRRTIVVFRAPLGAVTAAERAAAATRRLDALADSAGTDSIGSRQIAEGILVLVGGQGVFTIIPADVDTAGGQTLASVADDATARLRVALAAAREERSIPHLLWGAGLAALATILFFVALRVLAIVRRFVIARLPAAASTGLLEPSVAGFTLVSQERLLLFARRLLDVIIWAVGLFIAYLWLAFVLTRFAYTRVWGEALGAYLATTVTRLALAALSAIPGLFTVVLIFIATRWIARLVTAFFDAVEGGTVEVPWIHPETAHPTRRIVVALLWLFAVVVAYPYLPGSGSDVFKGVSVFAGLVLSLGSSGIVNQGMSGLVLMYARALRPGDYVRIGETEGTVRALGMLSTKIRTTKGEDVVLPNAVVVTTSVKNFSRGAAGDGLFLYTSVTIGYDTPWRQVEALLLMAAGRTAGTRTSPPPFVLKTALSDFYIEYQLNVAIERAEERMWILDRLHGNVADCFNEYGVQITSPHYEADPDEPKVVPRSRWHEAPAASPRPPADPGQ